MVWTLAPMTMDDIDAVLAIEHTLFSHPWSRISFVSELNHADAAAIVVRPGNVDAVVSPPPIVAYAVFRRIVDELHILKLGVSKPYQRRGIAQWLMQTCVDKPVLPATDMAFLEVRETNVSAIRFYRNNGFIIAGKRLGYYADTKEDALVMMKYLKEDDHEH